MGRDRSAVPSSATALEDPMSRFRLRVVSLVIVLALGAACARRDDPWRIAAADPATQRSTPGGDVVGGEGRYGSYAWLGIPFAAPPVGELRWRAPKRAEPWSGTRQALSFGNPCPQFASALGGVPGRAGEIKGDEDCLTLNVWTPKLAREQVPTGSARLPVMLWIHGGGNTIGATAFYDGGNLAATQNVVVVSTQYRLGAFGWMSHRALRAGAADAAEASGNFGVLDLIRSLEWVRDNIAAFGGDPGNVTIFGESAGGRNVYSLLLAPQARGLFQRAIVQSGGLWMDAPAVAEAFHDATPPGDAQSSSEIAARLLVKAGKAKDRGDAKAQLASLPDAELAAFLRARSMREILGAYDLTPSGMLRMPDTFGDGAVLPPGDGLAQLAEANGWNRVPVMIGTNRDENRLFMFFDPHWVKQILWIIPRFVDEQGFLATSEHLSNMWKATGADEPAAAMRGNEERVFVYRFDWDEEPTRLGSELSKMIGASHGFEIPFVFGHFELGRAGNMLFTSENEPGRLELAHALMSYWAAFARDGDPGRGAAGDLPAWTAWDPAPGGHKYAILDTAAGGGVRMGSEPVTREGVIAAVDADPRLATQRERCRVFHELVEWGRGLTREQYPTVGKQGCAEYPFDDRSWIE
jgi:para-nitrobenzyl esterase